MIVAATATTTITRINSPKEFQAQIELLVSNKGCTYMEAVLLYQAENGVEVETIASLVRSSHIIKSNILAEAEILKLVKKETQELEF